MQKPCANLTMLFTELPLLERFGRARSCGFHGVEVLFPYDTAANEIAELLEVNGLTLALINCPPPNYTGGPRGFAAIPGGASRFQYDFRRSLRYAQALGAERLHIMSGVAEGPEAHAVFVENLKWAAAFAPDQALTIEPINNDDMPGYFLNGFDLAREVLTQVDAPNLGLQFDAYHAQKITGDVLLTWAGVRDVVTHVQVAQCPDRSEPGAGVIDYAAFFGQLKLENYAGWVSGEYVPAGETEDGLDWMTS